MKIAVLGGGITGVTLTRLLVEQGHAVSCLEAASRTGGLCQSETIDGFVVDRAGGHIAFSRDEEVMAFVLEALESTVGYHTSTRNTYIHYRGRDVQYPFENGLGDLEVADTYACLRDYIEAHGARRQGAPVPADFKEWCRWRFGDAISDRFMLPYNEKIWNVDLTELGVAWVEDRVPDAPLDDVLKSALGVRTEGYVHQKIFHYPLTGGFEALVDAIKAPIPEGVIRTGAPCRSLEQRDGGWLVNGETFDRVVSTIPLPVLGRALADLPPAVARSFDRLDSCSVFTVLLALDRATVPDQSWVYFPHPENGPQNRITYLSNYSPNNAPPGKTSIMAEVTYHGDPPASDEEITREVVQGLARCGILDPREVQFTRGFHNRFAYILYRRDLEANLEVVRDHCRKIDLDIIGRFGNYDYFNSDACIRSAMDLARSYASPGDARP